MLVAASAKNVTAEETAFESALQLACSRVEHKKHNDANSKAIREKYTRDESNNEKISQGNMVEE